MSTTVARSFPNSKATEENKVGGRKKPGSTLPGKKHVSGSVNPVHLHPGKTFSTQPTTTPRRALGDLSNNAKKTPATNLKRESQPLSIQKPKISTTRKKSEASAAKPQQKQSSDVSAVSAAKQHKTKVVKSEDLPDIELMPVKGEKDFPDPPFVPPSYFKNLTRSLLSTPLALFDDMPVPDLVASLSVESEIRPGQRLQRYSPDVFDDLGSTAVDSLPPVEMPDIPDFTD